MIDRLAFLLLAALIFTIPWEKTVLLPGIGTLTRAVGMLAFLAGIGAVLMRRNARAPNLPLVLAAVFAAWSGLTWFWSLDPAATVARFLTYVQLLAMVWLVWELCRTRARQLRLLEMYIAGAVIASGATIWRYLERQQTYYRRYAAPGFDPNDLGITVALAIPLALYAALQYPGWRAWLYRAAIVPISIAILLTASRTAVVAACAGYMFLLWTWRRSGWLQRTAGLVLLGILPAGVVGLAPPAARERISTIGQEVTQGTLHNRTRIWKTGVRVLRKHPLVGVGAGAYPDAVRPWLGVPRIPGHEYVAHNAFLSVLVETGIAGACFYGAFLLAIALFIWVLRTQERALWAATLLVWMIGAFLLTWEHRKPGWVIFALIMTEWARCFSRHSAAEAVPE
jgi:O-antigen ligase